MIVEKYVANPGANEFSYVQVYLPRTMRLKSGFFACSVTNAGYYMFVYRGDIAAYNVTNHEHLAFAYVVGWHSAAGIVSDNYFNVDIELPAGSYTFAVYIITDVANARWAYHLI